MNNASLELGGDNWAAKDGNLLGYAVGDSSGKYVPNEFTFTRGSNLSATRVNEDGYIEKGYENLLTYSNQFNTTWANAGSTRTSGQSGYDGSNDAWLLESANTGQSSFIQSISQSGVQTASVYAKAGTSDWMFLYLVGSPDKNAWFNLSNGTLGNSTGIDSSIENIGNGWYRCSVSYNVTISSIRIYVSDGNGNVSSALGANIYIQDAMLNQGLAALPYIESGASTVKAGVLENEPRIDYSDGTASLLLEPQRTNALPHSEYLNAIGSKSNSLEINTSDTKSPEGVYNASKFDFTSGIRYIGPPIGAINDVAVSIFAKAGTHNFVQFVSSATNQFSINFDLSNGTSNVIGTAPSELQYDAEDYGNGWYRIWFYYDNAGIASSVYCWIVDSLTSTRASSVSTSGIVYLYGYQVEQGTYPTSYIPTYGTSQTRLKDAAPFPATFNFGTSGDGESGTIVVKTIVNGLTSNSRFNFFSNGGSANWYWNGHLLYAQTTGGSRQFDLGSFASSKLGTEVKLCMRKSANTLSCFFNGDDKGSIDIGSETIRYFDEFSTYFVSQSIVEFEEFPTALTDNECIELTTI